MLDQYREALRAFDGVLKRDPENIKAIYNVGGVVCFKQKLYETAARAFKEALSINPPWHEQSLRYLGISLAKIGEYEEALKAFEKLLRINPQDVQSMNYRGGSSLESWKGSGKL